MSDWIIDKEDSMTEVNEYVRSLEKEIDSLRLFINTIAKLDDFDKYNSGILSTLIDQAKNLIEEGE